MRGNYRGRLQPVHAGSAIVVPRTSTLDGLKSFTVAAMIWPTTPAKGRQGLVTHWLAAGQKGWGLIIDETGGVAFLLGDGRKTVQVAVGRPLLRREWYCVGASFDAERQEARVWQQALATYPGIDPGGEERAIVPPTAVDKSDAPLAMAAWVDELVTGGRAVLDGHYNGKIDSVRLFAGASIPPPPAAGSAARPRRWPRRRSPPSGTLRRTPRHAHPRSHAEPAATARSSTCRPAP